MLPKILLGLFIIVLVIFLSKFLKSVRLVIHEHKKFKETGKAEKIKTQLESQMENVDREIDISLKNIDEMTGEILDEENIEKDESDNETN